MIWDKKKWILGMKIFCNISKKPRIEKFLEGSICRKQILLPLHDYTCRPLYTECKTMPTNKQEERCHCSQGCISVFQCNAGDPEAHQQNFVMFRSAILSLCFHQSWLHCTSSSHCTDSFIDVIQGMWYLMYKSMLSPLFYLIILKEEFGGFFKGNILISRI
jgi:hypothetical protein